MAMPMDGSRKLKLQAQKQIPELVNTRRAAEILCRSAATLKRWRYEGVGPSWIQLRGRVFYDVSVLLDFIKKGVRTPAIEQWKSER